MTDSPSRWARPYHESQDRVASVSFFAFAEESLNTSSPVSRSRFGIPAEFDLNALDVRQHRRGDAAEWFDGFFTPELLRMSADDVPSLAEKCVDLAVAYSVQLEILEPHDLGYLQACWGFMMWLCEAGAQVVLDGHAIRWHAGERVVHLEPRRDFDIKNEVSVVLETEETSGFGYVMHTRGLAKFGRSDLILKGARPSDGRVGGVLLNGLATRAALGAPFREGQSVSPNGLPSRRLARYEPRLAHPEVNLNNDGLVLDITNWDLQSLG